MKPFNQSSPPYSTYCTRLCTIHHLLSTLGVPKESIDYISNLILKNGQPSMYLFDGGYATFNTSGALSSSGMYYYIQDYIGNNRMVVNRNGTVEQITHYYPYCGVIGDISTNENFQKYKFEGKELDRTFGLDNYDIHARQYFAMAPMWDRLDPLAEKFYSISPYLYCGGDPINYGDYNGRELFFINGFTANLGEMHDKSYWSNDVISRFQQLNGAGESHFIDGSVGGLYTLLFASTYSHLVRELYGYLQTRGKEEEIINSLRDKDGNIVEPLIVVTHSMGAAYAKGFLRRIMEYVNAHPEEFEGFSAVEYDLAPYQSYLQRTVDHVETYQYSHLYDFIAFFFPMRGRVHYMGQESLKDDKKIHSIGSFIRSIENLPEGKYKLVNGEWILVNN